MCNRCLHIIKTSQQIGWDHQYTQIVVCLCIRTHFPLPCVCVCFSKKKKNLSRTLPTIRLYIMKKIYLNQTQNLDKINQPTNPFTNPLH